VTTDRAGRESVVATAWLLAVDAMTAEVVRALRTAGIEPLLLKGPVLAAWLYDEGELRGYGDADLLVDPRRVEDAASVLTELGFERLPVPWDKWRRLHHAGDWRRARDGAVVDLHRTLPGVRASPPETVWRLLASHTAPWRLQPGIEVTVLDERARTMLVALHAAHHLSHGDLGKRPLKDLERALARVPQDTWRDAAALAGELNAGRDLSRGLHAVSGGAVLAAELGLPDPSTGDEELAGFERLAAARGTRARLRALLRSFAPTPEFLRWSSPLARRGRLGLFVAYLERPFWLLGQLPRAYRAWKRGRNRA
jgi:hypothetical protein